MDFAQADELNGAIRAICIKHRTAAAALLSRLGLHPGHEAVLLLLDRNGPQTQARLAVGAKCEPPSITTMVRKLEAGGLVSRQRSADDARALIVDLTPEGERIIPQLKALWQELAAATVANTDTPVDQLIAVLTDLAQSVERLVDDNARRA